VGYSGGEVAASYAGSSLTHAQALRIAYYLGKLCDLEAEAGVSMKTALVGLSWDEACLELRHRSDLYLVAHNTERSVSIAGASGTLEPFLETLKTRGIYHVLFDMNGVAFHSPTLCKQAEAMRMELRRILVNPKVPSAAWLSARFEPGKPKLVNEDFFVYSFLEPIYLYPAIQKIRAGSFVLEMSPKPLLKSFISSSLKGTGSRYSSISGPEGCTTFQLMKTLGDLFNEGCALDIPQLFTHAKNLPIGYCPPPILSSFFKERSNEKEVTFCQPLWTSSRSAMCN
jgi:acyl transferase domain-containing protein